VEDPTRAFRAVRFEARYGFTIGKQTLALLRHAVGHQLFNRLSGSRLFAELKAILNERRPVGAIKRLKELGLLRFVHQSLQFAPETERLMETMDDLLAWHDLAFPLKPAKGWFARLMILFEELSDDQIQGLKNTFPTARKIMEDIIENRIFAAEAVSAINRRGEPAPSQIHDLFMGASDEALLYLAARPKDGGAIAAVIKYLGEIKNIKPFVTGDDLLKAGERPSPELGAILRKVFAAQLDGRVTTKEDAIKIAEQGA